MQESIRNILLAGLGAAVLTKDKVLELTRTLVEQGKISAGEAEKVAEDLVEESKGQAKAWGEKLEQAVAKAVESLNLASREEVRVLEARLARLEVAVSLLTPQGEGAPDVPPPPAE